MGNRPIGILIAYGFPYGFFDLSIRENSDNQNRKIPRNRMIPRDLTGAAKQI